MSKLFIHIFNWFERHKKVFYAVLILLVAVFAVMASRISFQENIANFFDTSGGNKNAVFQSVKAKDKIIVLFSGEDPSQIIESAEIFQDELESLIRDSLVNSVTAYADEEVIAKVTSFIYEYLPIFLDDSDYQRLGQLSKRCDRQLYRQGLCTSDLAFGHVCGRYCNARSPEYSHPSAAKARTIQSGFTIRNLRWASLHERFIHHAYLCGTL